MNTKWISACAGAAIAAGLLAAGQGAAPRGGDRAPPVTVCAASSLRDLVEEVAAAWTGRTGTPVRLRVEATSILARQIREGAPADLFLAAAPEWLDGAAPLARRDWLGNRLVAVRREGSGPDALRDAGSLALANEQVPAGAYARAALQGAGIPLPGRVILCTNVRDVLSKVMHGAADAGVVYATDAAIEPAVEVLFRFPEGSHPTIVYAAGLLSERGRALFDALGEPWVREIAARRGFLVLP